MLIWQQRLHWQYLDFMKIGLSTKKKKKNHETPSTFQHYPSSTFPGLLTKYFYFKDNSILIYVLLVSLTEAFVHTLSFVFYHLSIQTHRSFYSVVMTQKVLASDNSFISFLHWIRHTDFLFIKNTTAFHLLT